MKLRNALLALAAATVLVFALTASLANVNRASNGQLRDFDRQAEPGVALVKHVRISLPIGDGAAAGATRAESVAAPPGSLQTDERKTAGTGPLRGHELARTGAIVLLVPDVEESLAAVGRLAALAGGAVLSLDDERPPAATQAHTAEIKIGVPAVRFERSMDRLASLGGLRSRTVNAQDLTDQIVDDAARLRNLRRTEADVRAIMDRAGKLEDVLDAENQLASTRDEIERLTAEAASLHEQVAYATIEVTLQSEGVVASAEPSVPGQLHDAWIAAFMHVRDFSLVFASVGFLMLAFAPYWLVILLGFAAATWYRRRRAQHAAIVL